MSILLITSDERRHRYLAARLAGSAGLSGVVSERKAAAVADWNSVSDEDRLVLTRHFDERNHAEERWLGDPGDFPVDRILRVAAGSVNEAHVYKWVEAQRPQVIVLYGTGVIRGPLLERFSDRMVNLHLGLSPYYRGTGTNFWPLVYREPECVGATIHMTVTKVDAGPILAQVRPDIEVGDRAHDLGTKTIQKAAGVLAEIVAQMQEHAVAGQIQDLTTGRVFCRRDFNADAVRTLWRNQDSGMIDEFLMNREERLRQFPIRTFPLMANSWGAAQ